MASRAFFGRVVLITEVSSGIGRAAALARRFVPGLFDRIARRMVERTVRRPAP